MWLLLLPLLTFLRFAPLDYPINPVPMRELWREADLVLVVEVGEPEWIKQNADSDEEDFEISEARVRLKVKETWKGKAPGEEVEVHFSAALVCPAPPRFEPGKTQLVYLEKTEKEHFRVVALSYGTVLLSKEAVKSYRKAIADLTEVQKIESKKDHHAAMFDWVFRLALDPHTRADGALELNESRKIWNKYSGNDWPFKMADLSAEKQGQLIQALEATPKLREQDLRLLVAFAKSEDPRLAELWLRYVLDNDKHPLFTGMYFHRALERFGNEKALKAFGERWRQSGISRSYWSFEGEPDEMEAAVAEIVAILREEG